MRVIILCLMLALTAGAAYADPPPFAPNAPSDASLTGASGFGVGERAGLTAAC